MTKEITKAYILQQMTDKFGLRDLEPEVFHFLETVVPVYCVEQHLKTWETFTVTKSVTGIGGIDIITVPSDRKWIVSGYTVTFMAAGAYKVAGMYVRRKNDYAIFVYLDLTKNQTESYTINLPKPVTLDSGDKLAINIDDYTSTANIMVNIDYVKEILR